MYKCVAVEEVQSFVERCMRAVGTDPQHSTALSQVLTEAEVRGHDTHGLNRLENYIRDIENGVTQPQGEPNIEKETVATALVNGNDLLGPVVGNFCMDLAIKKAREHGIGWVACKGSTHFGIAGWYSARALQQGMIGMSMTNTSPVVVPTRAAKPTIGTNPLSVAAPGRAGDSFQLDMATSAVAFGKVEMRRRKEIELPQGWGVNSKGQETVVPEEVVQGGGLMPLGGKELTGGYKGYGLAMMVDVFCGVLSGSAFGTNIRSWKGEDHKIANLVTNRFVLWNSFLVMMNELSKLSDRRWLSVVCTPVDNEFAPSQWSKCSGLTRLNRVRSQQILTTVMTRIVVDGSV